MDEENASADLAQDAAGDAARDRNAPARPLALLAVDDDPNVRRQVRAVVENAGYRVLTAVNSAEARELLNGGKDIDIIVPDAMMPATGGFELMRRIDQNARNAKLPLLILVDNAPDRPPIFN